VHQNLTGDLELQAVLERYSASILESVFKFSYNF